MTQDQFEKAKGLQSSISLFKEMIKEYNSVLEDLKIFHSVGIELNNQKRVLVFAKYIEPALRNMIEDLETK